MESEEFPHFSGPRVWVIESAISPALTTVASGQQATIFSGIPLSDTIAKRYDCQTSKGDSGDSCDSRFCFHIGGQDRGGFGLVSYNVVGVL